MGLYQLCLMAAQAHLIAHDLVLHRILQGGIQQDFHGFSLDKAHLNDALAETTVTINLHDDTLLACLQL